MEWRCRRRLRREATTGLDSATVNSMLLMSGHRGEKVELEASVVERREGKHKGGIGGAGGRQRRLENKFDLCYRSSGRIGLIVWKARQMPGEIVSDLLSSCGECAKEFEIIDIASGFLANENIVSCGTNTSDGNNILRIVCFIIGDEKISCEGQKIACLSVPFHAMLNGCFMESFCEDIDLSENSISPSGMRVISDFSITGSLNEVQPNLLLEILVFANRFCCESLKDACDRKLASLVSSRQDVQLMECSCLFSLLITSLKFEEVTDAYGWHQDVQLISIFDLSSSELLGYFYLDIYAREGKYGHSCVVALQNGSLIQNARQIPVALLISQLQKEVDGRPGLLRSYDVFYFWLTRQSYDVF
ncbi:unnamed protein product [Fraxinus pennsylvanica]|uniref:BTB domain-containing protein n=1 Tax=Fraxinus pennsylvanica TaxID=56036 RepID=A0AAD1YUP2_9LAMI|nr:unnamed protein product [Fraxinus pennsylvanica]